MGFPHLVMSKKWCVRVQEFHHGFFFTRQWLVNGACGSRSFPMGLFTGHLLANGHQPNQGLCFWSNKSVSCQFQHCMKILKPAWFRSIPKYVSVHVRPDEKKNRLVHKESRIFSKSHEAHVDFAHVSDADRFHPSVSTPDQFVQFQATHWVCSSIGRVQQENYILTRPAVQ